MRRPEQAPCVHTAYSRRRSPGVRGPLGCQGSPLLHIPFCPCEGRQVSLGDLSAVCRYTARIVTTSAYQSDVVRCGLECYMRVGSTSFNLLRVSSRFLSVVAQSIQPSVTETPYWSWDRSAGMDCWPKLILLSSMEPISDWLPSRIWCSRLCSTRFSKATSAYLASCWRAILTLASRPFPPDQYGVSVADGCIDWATTDKIVLDARRPRLKDVLPRSIALQPASDHVIGMHLSVTMRVVYLAPADKYHRLTRRPSQGQKGLDERALMASQRPSHPW